MSHGYEMPGAAYRRFKAQATEKLELLLNYTLHLGNSEFSKALKKAEMFYSRLAVLGLSTGQLQHELLIHWEPEIQKMTEILMRLSRVAYTLSKTSENEALARVIPTKNHTLSSLETKQKASIFLGDPKERVRLLFEDQASRIARAVRIGKVLGESPDRILKRILKTYPPLRVVTSQKKTLAKPKLREANLTQKALRDAIDVDFYDENEWQDLVDLYKEANLWSGRFENEEGEPRYKFQFEQEATEEFVGQVRRGEIQAANDQGIDDFVWTAILDARTCEKCCEKRDGLLVSEIEQKLKSTWKADECQATVPPAHINCRCQVLPVKREYLPEESNKDVSFTGIDEWLNPKT